jgi:hypothetical protein
MRRGGYEKDDRMIRPRQFTMKAMMFLVAASGVACAALLVLATAWEPLAYYVGKMIPEPSSAAWLCGMVLMVFGTPWLLAASGLGLWLFLFPIRSISEPSKNKVTK